MEQQMAITDPEKCIQISIKTSCIKDPPSNYTIDSTLSLSDNARDLGVLIDDILTYKAHINTIVHKAFVRSRLHKCFRTRDKNVLTRAYCTSVRPILEYCSSIWSPHSKQLALKIERAQKYFTGAIPGFRALPYHSRLQVLGLLHRLLVNDLVPLLQNSSRSCLMHNSEILFISCL